MNTEETARKFYESARQEIIQRIQLRDNVILTYLGAVATIFGIALGTTTRPEIVLIIPYLSLGATILVVQHHGVIGAIGNYLKNELDEKVQEKGNNIPQWDTSLSIKDYVSYSMKLRSFGHFLLIITPAVAGLSLSWHNGF